MPRNDCTEACGRGLYGPIDERKFGDVVLVDHAEHGFLFAHVHLRVLNFLLVRRFELSEAVVGDQVHRLLLGLAMESAEGRGDTAR